MIATVGKIRGDARPYGMQGIDLLQQILEERDEPIRFPRSFLPHAAAERLLMTMGVEIVDDATLDEKALAWLIGQPVDTPAVRAVRDRLAARRRAA